MVGELSGIGEHRPLAVNRRTDQISFRRSLLISYPYVLDSVHSWSRFYRDYDMDLGGIADNNFTRLLYQYTFVSIPVSTLEKRSWTFSSVQQKTRNLRTRTLDAVAGDAVIIAQRILEHRRRDQAQDARRCRKRTRPKSPKKIQKKCDGRRIAFLGTSPRDVVSLLKRREELRVLSIHDEGRTRLVTRVH